LYLWTYGKDILFFHTFTGKFYSIGGFDYLIENGDCGDRGLRECGVPQVYQRLNHETRDGVLLTEDDGRLDGDGCGGWRGASAGCDAEGGALITPLD